jgi:hypothetical protein
VTFDKFKGAERFHGMKKFHLNNCAQDGSYLNELIAGEMARVAGVCAPLGQGAGDEACSRLSGGSFDVPGSASER